MKLTIKTLKGPVFTLDVEAETTVGQLKQRLEKEQGEEYNAAGLKLIHAGKILSDDQQTIGQCNIKETEFIVVMTSKPKAGAAKPAPAAAAAPPTPAQAAPPATPAVTSTPATAPPAPAHPSAPAAAPSDGLTVNPSEETIAQLIEMGFVRDDVVAALRAAFGNRDRAVEYLSTGSIPMQTEASAPVPATPLAPAAAPAAPAASAPAAPAATAPAASGAPAGGFHLSPSSPLAVLAANPQFIQLRSMVHRQPELLPTLLQQLGQHNPQLIQLINDNQEDFYNLLNMTTGGAPPGAGAMQIQVTAEENEAINRLCQLGFDRSLVIQAYFACDKNETLAANFLFQSGGE
eukprot:m.222203 g.222203  ORF g.222203 m.222203 type:complete len:347 (+) comp10729_c0_seq1:4317-5357(+)